MDWLRYNKVSPELSELKDYLNSCGFEADNLVPKKN